MNNELKYSFQKFSKALARLNDGVKKTKNELDKDGVIQRFEFTFELVWKTLRIFLFQQGIVTNSPKEVLKESFKFGIITDEDTYLDMLNDRNQTSHIYSEVVSRQIFTRIKKYYLPSLLELAKKLKPLIELK